MSIDRSYFNLPERISLADRQFHESYVVDMLIGVDTFWNLLCVGQIKPSRHPLLHKTQLGWIVTGKLAGRQFPIRKTCSEMYATLGG